MQNVSYGGCTSFQSTQILKAELAFGLLEFDSFSRNALVDMIEDRHGRKSTIIASQLPIALWYEAIGEDTVADMVMDRLVYNAYRLELEGDNLRKQQNKKPETRMNT